MTLGLIFVLLSLRKNCNNADRSRRKGNKNERINGIRGRDQKDDCGDVNLRLTSIRAFLTVSIYDTRYNSPQVILLHALKTFKMMEQVSRNMLSSIMCVYFTLSTRARYHVTCVCLAKSLINMHGRCRKTVKEGKVTIAIIHTSLFLSPSLRHRKMWNAFYLEMSGKVRIEKGGGFFSF